VVPPLSKKGIDKTFIIYLKLISLFGTPALSYRKQGGYTGYI